MGIKTCGLGSRVKILTVMQLNHDITWNEKE